MAEDMLRTLTHESLSLKQYISHIVRNYGLHRAREVSCSELCVAFCGIWARVIDVQIHSNKRSNRLQCLLDLLLILARKPALHILP